MFRKAQSALEFLTTYGWAFLVILIMIGALAYFGVLDPSRFLPDKCLFTTGISCDEGFIDSAGPTINARLVNGLGKNIVVDDYADAAALEAATNVNGGDCNIAGATLTVEGTANNLIDGTATGSNWQSGEEALLAITCTAGDFAEGDRLTVETEFTYSEAGSTFTKTMQGTIAGAAQ